MILGEYNILFSSFYIMAKKSRSQSRRQSRRQSRGHKMRSRMLSGGSYSSASTYGEYVNGNSGDQYNRVFNQDGSYGRVQGNVIIGAQGQNVQSPTMVPSQSNLSRIQSAGKRRRKKGGFLGQIVNQAIVPFALLGMQNTYRRKKSTRGRRTRRRTRR